MKLQVGGSFRLSEQHSTQQDLFSRFLSYSRLSATLPEPTRAVPRSETRDMRAGRSAESTAQSTSPPRGPLWAPRDNQPYTHMTARQPPGCIGSETLGDVPRYGGLQIGLPLAKKRARPIRLSGQRAEARGGRETGRETWGMGWASMHKPQCPCVMSRVASECTAFTAACRSPQMLGAMRVLLQCIDALVLPSGCLAHWSLAWLGWLAGWLAGWLTN